MGSKRLQEIKIERAWLPTPRRIRFFFAWYDFWVGAFYNRDNFTLYICPLPMIVVAIRLKFAIRMRLTKASTDDLKTMDGVDIEDALSKP